MEIKYIRLSNMLFVNKLSWDSFLQKRLFYAIIFISYIVSSIIFIKFANYNGKKMIIISLDNSVCSNFW